MGLLFARIFTACDKSCWKLWLKLNWELKCNNFFSRKNETKGHKRDSKVSDNGILGYPIFIWLKQTKMFPRNVQWLNTNYFPASLVKHSILKTQQFQDWKITNSTAEISRQFWSLQLISLSRHYYTWHITLSLFSEYTWSPNSEPMYESTPHTASTGINCQSSC